MTAEDSARDPDKPAGEKAPKLRKSLAVLSGEEGEPAAPAQSADAEAPPSEVTEKPAEIGGPSGPEPTRYGDWERKGRCIDF